MTRRLRPARPSAAAKAVQQLLVERSRAVISLDVAGYITDAPGWLAAALSLRPDEFLGAPLEQFVLSQDRQQLRDAIQRAKQGELAPSSATLRLVHPLRTHGLPYEYACLVGPDGTRVVLNDTASWRAVAAAEGEIGDGGASPGGGNQLVSEEPSATIALSFDRAGALVRANAAWTLTTGIYPSLPTETATPPATWMARFDLKTITTLQRVISDPQPGLFTGWLTGIDPASPHGTVRLVDIPVVIAVGATGPTGSCRVLTAFQNGPCHAHPHTHHESTDNPARSQSLGGRAEGDHRMGTPAQAQSEPSNVERVAGVRDRTHSELDEQTRSAIATILATAHQHPAPDPELHSAGLFDEPETPRSNSDEFMSTRDEGPARLEVTHRVPLNDHLELLHEDGLGAVVSTALLLIEVDLDGLEAADVQYEFNVMERRLRSGVREHEYAARAAHWGFVVAARGAFGDDELRSLALRISNKLRGPVRGNDRSNSSAVRVSAVRSRPGESDDSLINRAERAAAHAKQESLSLYAVGLG